MASLWDNKSKSLIENVQEDEVNQMVVSGQYSLPAENDQIIYLKDGSGEPTPMRGDIANGYIRDGTFTYATPLEVEKFKENEQFANSTIGGFSAAAMGIDDWLFAGLGTNAGQAAGLIDEGLPEAVQAGNPFLWNMLGVPAAGIASFFSGGTATGARAALGTAGTAAKAAAKSSLLNQAAQGTVKNGFNKSAAVLSDYTLPGLSAKLAEKATKGSSEALVRLGDKYVPRVIKDTQMAKNFGPGAAKILGATTGGLVEGGAWGAGEGISESLIGEPEESAEHILNTIGTNALMGAAFGGAISSILPVLVGSKGVMAKIADKALEKSGQAGGAALNKARNTIVGIATEVHQLSPEHANELAKILLPGDKGATAYNQLRELIDNIDGYAKSVSLQLDSQLLADDILQIADQGGFRLDYIEDLVRNTRNATEPAAGADALHYEISQNPKVIKARAQLDQIDGLLDEGDYGLFSIPQNKAAITARNKISDMRNAMHEAPAIKALIADKRLPFVTDSDKAVSFLEREISKLEEVAYGPRIKFVKGLKSASGKRRVSARTDKTSNQILIDKKEAKRTFQEKAWTKPKVAGVDPLPDDAFKTIDEWQMFLIEHERVHFSKQNLAIPPGAAKENDANKQAYQAVINSRNELPPLNLEGTPEQIKNQLLSLRTGAQENLNSIRNSLSNERMRYDAESVLPDSSVEVLQNLEGPFAAYRADIEKIFRENVNLDSKGATEIRGELSDLIHKLNMDELNLYRELLDDEVIRNIEAVQAKVSGAPRSPREALVQNLAKAKQRKRIEKFLNHWESIYENSSKYQALENKFKKAVDQKRKKGSPYLNYPDRQLEDAVQIAAETGDIGELLKLADDYGLNRKTLLMGSGTSPAKLKEVQDILVEMKSVDVGEIATMSVADRARTTRDALDGLIAASQKKDPLGSGQNISYLDGPGIFSDVLNDADKATFREALHGIIDEMGMTPHFNTKVVAKSWKAMEQAQTNLLDVLKSGRIGADEGIKASIMAVPVHRMRTAMSDIGKWGLLAKEKTIFDTLRKSSEEIRTQVLGRFTQGVGLYQLADPKKIQAYLNTIDKNTADIDRSRLSEYYQNHDKLLEMLKNKFTPVDLLDTPDEITYLLSEKLEKLNRMGIKDPRVAAQGFRESWGDRIDDLRNFMKENDDKLNGSLNYINEKLPMAKALLGDQSKSASMNAGMRDFTRGGVAGAAAYALTGSSQLAMAAGAISGTVGVAQTPRQLVALINQLRSTRIASQKVIGEYLDDWALNQVPKAAIHKGWEFKSRQAFFVAAGTVTRDKKESRSEIRSRAAKSRAIDTWADKIGIALDAELTEENFYDSRNAIEQLSKNSMLMDRFLKETTQPFEGVPGLQTAMKSLIRNHISIAKRAIPPTTQATIFGDEYPPTPQQLAKFQRILQVLTDPTETILTAMITGSITKDMVQTLQEAWPQIHSDIVEKSMEIISDQQRNPNKEKKLSQSQQQTLSMLLGMNYANPEELSRLQEPYKPEEQGKAPGRKNDMSGLTAAFGQGTMATVRGQTV